MYSFSFKSFSLLLFFDLNFYTMKFSMFSIFRSRSLLASFFSISHVASFVNYFFSSFFVSSLGSSAPCDSLSILPNLPLPVNRFFCFFSFFFPYLPFPLLYSPPAYLIYPLLTLTCWPLHKYLTALPLFLKQRSVSLLRLSWSCHVPAICNTDILRVSKPDKPRFLSYRVHPTSMLRSGNARIRKQGLL